MMEMEAVAGEEPPFHDPSTKIISGDAATLVTCVSTHLCQSVSILVSSNIHVASNPVGGHGVIAVAEVSLSSDSMRERAVGL